MLQKKLHVILYPFYRTFRLRVLNKLRLCALFWQDGMDCCESN